MTISCGESVIVSSSRPGAHRAPLHFDGRAATARGQWSDDPSLTDADDRAAYARAACAAVPAAGVLIVATFGPEGPERCAGLAVARYDADALGEQFAPGFELVAGGALTPPSTAGDQRPYVAIVARRTGRARPAN